MDSPRLRALYDAVRDQSPSAVEEFWDEVAVYGSPLVEATDTTDLRLVTLLWREAEPLAGVYAMVNRLTDKGRVAAGMMRRMRGTGVWFVTLTLPVTLRSSYRLYPFTVGDRFFADGIPDRLDIRAVAPHTVPDPLNPRYRNESGRGFGSLIELPNAPSLAEWSPARGRASGRLSSFDFSSVRTGETYRIRRYLPTGPAPAGGLGMLILFDAQRWFDDFGIPHAVDAAVAAGRCAPMGIIGVESPATPPERMRQLAASRPFLEMLAEELLPFVTSDETPWGGTDRRILCGQSLGGLSALAAALWTPHAYGAVLAQSPSVWWRPGGSATPNTYTDSSTSWLFEQFRSAAPPSMSIRIDAGSNEGLITEHLHTLRDLLKDRGFRSSLHIYTGGHDYPCWAAALLSGLADLHRK